MENFSAISGWMGMNGCSRGYGWGMEHLSGANKRWNEETVMLLLMTGFIDGANGRYLTMSRFMLLIHTTARQPPTITSLSWSSFFHPLFWLQWIISWSKFDNQIRKSSQSIDKSDKFCNIHYSQIVWVIDKFYIIIYLI